MFFAFTVVYLVAALTAALIPQKALIVYDGKTIAVETRKILVRDILKENKIEVSSFDRVSPSPDSCLADTSGVIEVKKAKKVFFKKAGLAEVFYSFAETRSQLESELGLKDTSQVGFLLSGSFDKSLLLVAEKVSWVNDEKLVYFYDKNQNEKNQIPGVKKVNVRELYFGKRLIAVRAVGEKVVKWPAKKIASKSVMHRKKTYLASRGDSKRPEHGNRLIMIATAYAPGAGAGYITATGKRAQYGIAAVDPDVIPLGTRLYIPGYGYAVAADTGGAIQGMRIDLCFNSRSEAIRWGRRRVEVYIVK